MQKKTFVTKNINGDFFVLEIDNFQLKTIDIFLIFAQNLDCRYMLEPPGLLTSTRNLFFGGKIRKTGIPCVPQFFYIKVGFKGIYITRKCFRNG